jgi:hypothetical protein
MVEAVIGADALNRRLNAVASADVGKGLLGRLGLRVVREAKLRVARKTGNTGRTIHIASHSATEVRIVAGGAAVFLERGTRPHVIRPKNKKVLRWGATPADRRLSGRLRKGGNAIFAREVHHPGTRARPFMAPAVKVALQQSHLSEAIIEVWNEAA